MYCTTILILIFRFWANTQNPKFYKRTNTRFVATKEFRASVGVRPGFRVHPRYRDNYPCSPCKTQNENYCILGDR